MSCISIAYLCRLKRRAQRHQPADKPAPALENDKTGNPVSTDHPNPKTRHTENTASVSTRPEPFPDIGAEQVRHP